MPMGVPCLHENFEVEANVARLVDDDKPLRFNAEIRIRCHQCQQSFMFLGVGDVGYRPDRPCTDVSAQELTVPIMPWDGRVAMNARYVMSGSPEDQCLSCWACHGMREPSDCVRCLREHPAHLPAATPAEPEAQG